MTTDFRTLLENLVEEVLDANQYKPPGVQRAIDRARAALAEREPKRRYIYNPVQIAECGGPCKQGPEHCDCGELWVTEPEPERPDAGEVMQLADNYFSFRGNSHQNQFFATSMEARKDPTQSLQDFARAVLARWGRPS